MQLQIYKAMTRAGSRIIFISDDVYFMIGLQQFQTYFLRNGRHKKLSPDEDIFDNGERCLYILNIKNRDMFTHQYRRLQERCIPCLILVSLGGQPLRQEQSCRWLLVGKVSPEELLCRIRYLLWYRPQERGRLGKNGKYIIQSLCLGDSVDDISHALTISPKTISAIKRNILKNVNLEHYNDLGVIILGDLLQQKHWMTDKYKKEYIGWV